jgi:hypothetical protein
MGASVITKIEYKPVAGGNYTELSIIPHTGTFNEQKVKSRAGFQMDYVCGFKVTPISQTNDTLMESLAGKRSIWQITTSEGIKYVVGDATYKAEFVYQKRVEGDAGMFTGYECTITLSAPTAAPMG